MYSWAVASTREALAIGHFNCHSAQAERWSQNLGLSDGYCDFAQHDEMRLAVFPEAAKTVPR
jgi:hypothetical protein